MAEGNAAEDMNRRLQAVNLEGDNEKKTEDYIEENEVHPDWKRFILEDESITNGLKKAVTFLNDNVGEYIPQDNKILRAFHFKSPSNIKAVILGHDPIPNAALATGLAFSLPSEKTEKNLPKDETGKPVKGISVIKVNKAICEALGVPYEDESSLCNEYLAKNGILLLNSALTVGRYSGDRLRREHFDAWKDFTFSLLKKLIKIKNERNEDLIILCWGDNAKDIDEQLQKKFKKNKSIKENIMTDCDHPTWPREESDNNFKTKAPEQFKKILEKHPDIFKKQQ